MDHFTIQHNLPMFSKHSIIILFNNKFYVFILFYFFFSIFLRLRGKKKPMIFQGNSMIEKCGENDLHLTM